MVSEPIQEPVAIVGIACRLPGGNTNPQKLWDFLERGGIASNEVPKSRFNIAGHWDGSHKPRTMRPLGGMFLEDIDPAEFDAGFFEISRADAISMDPNQRQMLEVVYEALENAGIPLESLDNAPVGCFVGSFASDYADMQGRDPENRPANITVGIGRAILANRLSHFLNVKGPSMTIDTACSGSLVGLDVACRYLQSGEINAAIISTSNLYLNPEHVMDIGAVGNAHSPTGLCHTFDISADGYVKAEAVSAVILKRLDDAIRDRDPIRGVIRGSSTNSDGRTPGIASPSAEAQAVAIRAAYRRAGITDYNGTAYLECHGTGTQAGDPTEVGAAGSVFSSMRNENNPLIIGSIKSNIGHAEPAAGISGLIKALMAIEKGIIPGNPTFENPNPRIDFANWKVKATRTAIAWPAGGLRRASVNSFGYGGSNVHVVLEQAPALLEAQHVSSFGDEDDGFMSDDEEAERPALLLFSANDESSLRANIKTLSNHLINPRVKLNLIDLAYTLSERRTKMFHRAFIATKSTEFYDDLVIVGKKNPEAPRVGLIFTGQGAQWPQMGKALLASFPSTRSILEELDATLQSLPNPPQWSLINELTQTRTPEHLRQPEFSQPLVTALQLCLVAVLESWGIKAQAVVGHSSGEIAAAYAAGLLSRSDAVKAAFYRGQAAVNCKHVAEKDVGMLAVGISATDVAPFMEKYADNCWIACYNSPSSLTVSGRVAALEALRDDLKTAGHFARLLQVSLAYHSKLMDAIGGEYEGLLGGNLQALPGSSEISMFSSVTGVSQKDPVDALYWKKNMVSPVRFNEAVTSMLSSAQPPNFLIEVGPSGALAGPVSQILKSLPKQGADITYCAAWSRTSDAVKALFDVAGRLFIAGSPVNISAVNQYSSTESGSLPSTIIDLPNYSWNHSVKWWYENESSKDWRFKKFVNHDLLGSKILGSSWEAPTWRKILNSADIPWLKDHKMGLDVLMPGSGFIAMGLEAMYQKAEATSIENISRSANDLSYRFRNVRFDKALVIEDGKDIPMLLTLTPQDGGKDWHHFRISSTLDDVYMEHCHGLVRLQKPSEERVDTNDSTPLAHPTAGRMWYQAQEHVGYSFGPAFQRLLKVESISGKRTSRSLVSLTPPASKWSPQSNFPIHPAALDGCFQTVTPAIWAGERSSLNSVIVPSIIDDLVINRVSPDLANGLSLASSEYSGRGRVEEAKSYFANCSVFDSNSGVLLIKMSGLLFSKLDTGSKNVDPHVFDRISWKPDISFLSQEQLHQVCKMRGSVSVEEIIDLIAHKKPDLKVLEVNIDKTDHSSVWFQAGHPATRAAYSQYTLASYDANVVMDAQTKYESKRNASFVLLNQATGLEELTSAEYNLVILPVSDEVGPAVQRFIPRLASFISPDTYVVVVHSQKGGSIVSSPRTPGSPGSATNSEAHDGAETPLTSASLSLGSGEIKYEGMPGSKNSAANLQNRHMDEAIPAQADNAQLGWTGAETVARLINSHLPGSLLRLENKDQAQAVVLIPSLEKSNPSGPRELCLARFADYAPEFFSNIKELLAVSGWAVSEQKLPLRHLPTRTPILIVDELVNPLLTDITAEQWEELQKLVATGNKILWVTKGAQYTIQEPNNALAHGLFRVIRMEDHNAKLFALDVESSSNMPATCETISRVLSSLEVISMSGAIDTEFAERDGVIHVHRVIPDEQVNLFKHDDINGAEPILSSLRSTENPVSLRAERLGTFDSLMWCETSPSPVPVKEGEVEVDVMAAGVNFKDVAVTMGIVPENEFTLGYEAAGIVRRLGPGVTKFKEGDRVCFLANGSFANRLNVPTGRAHVIPDAMSFEDAATIPSVYLASIYSLFDIGNLKTGQSVLIHSASGGVGLSCIQLAKHVGAEIFVTVGTEEKRKFLVETYGIPPNRIFSSRDVKFAKEILRETNGRGIDVIINSLTGDILDETWRICADGGTMVEIGKKDIVDRGTLSMEPFDRNCSFRAMDFSYSKDIVDSKIEGLLTRIFDLVNAGHIGPIHPVTIFGFDEVPQALAYIRSGRHTGKVVISDGGRADIQVPTRHATPSLLLRGDASYLIVGGLKGLCGSWALHMARQGAKKIIICSRSGISDEASQKVALNCLSHGCQVVEARGDVGDSAFVKKMFAEASPRIAGLVQGAMVLRDKPFELMSLDDYHSAIYAKIRGTWALHEASLELEEPLDFFTMMSSISGIVGKKGQSNYSAANTFLDAFAEYRRSLGLRANAVDLGLIEDVGYVAEQGGMEVHFDKRQWTPIREGMLRRILSYSILQQMAPINPASGSQLITGISFPLPDDSNLARESRFSYLFTQNGADKGKAVGEGNTGDQAIRTFHLLRNSGQDVATMAGVCTELLVRQFTKVLRLDTAMEPAKAPMAYGVDSLAAVELRNWVRAELGAELTTLDITNASSLITLSEKLISKLPQLQAE
ncbi:putative polyketide synthase protein [Paramyrothecium foliicola]|nr:putative polyketide synthase protein [Paramyrothecium foliicola]